jgi:hypothetical protein
MHLFTLFHPFRRIHIVVGRSPDESGTDDWRVGRINKVADIDRFSAGQL